MAESYKTWRDMFAPKIAAVLRQYPEDCPERKKALREVWPRCEPRKYWPHKVYLDEIAKQTGKKSRSAHNIWRNVPGHLELPFD